MFDLNNIECKKARIKEIETLIIKVSEVPGNFLNLTESSHIVIYLEECKKDLEKQVKEEEKRFQKPSRIDIATAIFIDIRSELLSQSESKEARIAYRLMYEKPWRFFGENGKEKAQEILMDEARKEVE